MNLPWMWLDIIIVQVDMQIRTDSKMYFINLYEIV